MPRIEILRESDHPNSVLFDSLLDEFASHYSYKPVAMVHDPNNGLVVLMYKED